MAATTLAIALPADLAQMVDDKVASGEYENADAIVIAGLRDISAQNHALENWLRNEVVPECARVVSGEAEMRTGAEVLTRLGI